MLCAVLLRRRSAARGTRCAPQASSSSETTTVVTWRTRCKLLWRRSSKEDAESRRTSSRQTGRCQLRRRPGDKLALDDDSPPLTRTAMSAPGEALFPSHHSHALPPSVSERWPRAIELLLRHPRVDTTSCTAFYRRRGRNVCAQHIRPFQKRKECKKHRSSQLVGDRANSTPTLVNRSLTMPASCSGSACKRSGGELESGGRKK